MHYQVTTLAEPRYPSPLNRFVDDDLYVPEHIVRGLPAQREEPLFELAGPRERLFFDPSQTRAGIVTSRGKIGRKKAARVLAKYPRLHPRNIAQKTIIVAHFHAVTRHKIGGSTTRRRDGRSGGSTALQMGKDISNALRLEWSIM